MHVVCSFLQYLYIIGGLKAAISFVLSNFSFKNLNVAQTIKAVKTTGFDDQALKL